MYDVIVCGKGPAGIQAAVYAKRANMNVLIIGKDGGALAKTDKIANYFGFDLITGPDLLEKGLDQARKLDIEIKSEEVTGVSYAMMGGFDVSTSQGKYEAKAVILATGSPRASLPIKGLKNYEGKGVSYCAICDAFFYRKKIVAVLGNADYAAQEAHELVEVADKVIVFTNGLEASGHFDERVQIITDKVVEIIGENTVKGVQLENGELIEVAGVFVAVGSASATDLALKMGALVEKNKIIVDEKQASNVPGLFAAGDCTPGLMQIAKAVGEGCTAGLEAVAYVRSLK